MDVKECEKYGRIVQSGAFFTPIKGHKRNEIYKE